MFSEVMDFLKMNDVKYKENASLKRISPIGIGASAKIVAYPDSEEKLVLLLRFLGNVKIQNKILGRMSNVLPPDEDYIGVVVRTELLRNYRITGELVSVDCGASLPRLAANMAAAGFSGLEELSGIPGSIGGSVVGNAGAFGRELSDLVVGVKVYDLINQEILTFGPPDLEFSYRHSNLKCGRYIVLSVCLKLVGSDKDTVRAAMSRFRDIRRKTQPVGELSLGSTFKRPGEGLYAAKMIDECGLKGKSIGGAMVSRKHAGFIVNTDGARAKDYLELSEYVKKVVFDRFSVVLEREVEILS